MAELLVQESSKRLVSLDVFRGITIASMILVNNTTGKTHPQLVHIQWNGWHITDLIFPFFLFIVGVALVYSI
jgi:predicted acyltransferase